MEIFHDLELNREINIKNSFFQPQDRGKMRLSGLVFEGKLSWRVVENTIRVVSVESGTEVAFLDIKYHRECPPTITAVAEVKFYQETCVLAIGIDYKCQGGFSVLKIFSVQGSKVLCTWDICEKITCIYDIDKLAAINMEFGYEQGCLAVGTEKGKVFCFDMQLPINSKALHRAPDNKEEMFNVIYEKHKEELHDQRCRVLLKREDGDNSVYFAFQLAEIPFEDDEEEEEIHSMLLLPHPLYLAVGLSRGRMVLYDMRCLQITHIIRAPDIDNGLNDFSLRFMTFIEPVDDPDLLVYVWALYKSKLDVQAVLHTLEFKSIAVDEGYEFYEDFIGVGKKLILPIGEDHIYPIGCQTISKPVKHDEDDMMKLCILSFATLRHSQVYVIVFDLNKFYSEWCPKYGDWKQCLSYAPVFIIDERICWDLYLDKESVTAFDSFDRAEEHTLPLSLSFDLTLLGHTHIRDFYWKGPQTKALAQYNLVGPIMILEPSYYFKEMLDAHIKPKFSFINYRMATAIEKKRELLLTVALEYNQIDFLKKCIWAWSDGSMLSSKPTSGVSLSTLTNWIWRRVQMMKDYCNKMCMSLFDFSGIRIDVKTQKYLSSCYRQLKVLSELLNIIMKDHRKFIPDDIFASLKQKARSIEVNSDYQEVLQWLLNVGLLPEGKQNHLLDLTGDEEFVIVPYPYEVINSHYTSARQYFRPEKEFFEEDSVDQKLLYIDAFIAKECSEDKLEKAWQSNYPPKTIQGLLRTLLIEDLSIEKKGILFIYFFMDMANILHHTSYSNIVKNLIKFPTVFNINSAVIKQTQAFWHLDNGNYNMAVDEAISPLANEREIPQWMRELMLCILLRNGAYPLALKVLRCPGSSIRPMLELAVLLHNNLFNEAYFHQQKSDSAVKEKFFEFILESGEKGILQLLGVSFDEEEAKFFHSHLEKSGLSKTFNIHFVSLIKESKFTEAAKLVDQIEKAADDNAIDTEPSKHILGAFMSLLDSTTQKITNMTSSETDILQGVSFPDTFSASVILNGGSASRNIYKRCIESINHAMNDVTMVDKEEKKEVPFIGYPKLGIFEYRRQQKELKNAVIPIDMNDLNESSVNINGKRKIQRSDGVQGGQTKRIRINEIQNDPKFNQFLESRIDSFINKPIPKVVPRSMQAGTSSSTCPSKNLPKEFFDTLEMVFGCNSLDESKLDGSQHLDVTPTFDPSEKENALEKYLTPSPTALLKQREASLRIQIGCPTPKSVQLFSGFEEGDDTDTLPTPFVKKRVPFQNIALPAPPPTSILKTRSDRGSISPTPSRTSEFGETKSVKSITFAAVPESRESSFAHDSSNQEESFSGATEQMDSSNHEESFSGAQEQIDSSNDKFYSPEKVKPNDSQGSSPTLFLTQGPKARPSINSSFKENINASFKENANTSIISQNIHTNISENINESYGSVLNSSCPFFEIFEEEEPEPEPEKFRFPQRSPINDTSESNDVSSSKESDKNFDDDEEIADDEHFEEEELPEHSDYEEDKNKNTYEGIDIESSDSSDRSLSNAPTKIQNDIIEIDDSDDDVVISESSPLTIILPPFSAVQNEIQQATDFIELKNQALEDQVIDTMTYQKFDVEYDEQPLKIEAEAEQSMEETAIEALLGLKNNERENIIEKEEELLTDQASQMQPTNVDKKELTSLNLAEDKDELLCDNEVESLLEEMPASDQFKKLQFSKRVDPIPSTSQSQPQKLRPFSVPVAVENLMPKQRLRPLSAISSEIESNVKPVTSPLDGVRITRSKSQLLSQENRGLTPQPQTPTRSKSRAASEILSLEIRGLTPQPQTPTRSKSRAASEILSLEIRGLTPQPQTPTRSRSRAASEVSDSAKTPSRRRLTNLQTTPIRKNTRSFSRESLNSDETIEEPKAKTPRRDRSKRGSEDGETSQILEEPSAITRRTTRSQLSILQESPISIKSTMSPQRAKKSKIVESADESDESLSSSISSTRTTRKRKSSTQSDSTAPKRKSPTHELTMIPEENTEDVRMISMSSQKQKKK